MHNQRKNAFASCVAGESDIFVFFNEQDYIKWWIQCCCRVRNPATSEIHVAIFAKLADFSTQLLCTQKHTQITECGFNAITGAQTSNLPTLK